MMPKFTKGAWDKFRFPKQLRCFERHQDTHKINQLQNNQDSRSTTNRIKILDDILKKANLKEITNKLNSYKVQMNKY